MGNTITVPDVPEGLTVGGIVEGDMLLRSDSLDITLGDERTLVLKNVPDCWVGNVCRKIGERVGKVVDSDEAKFDGVLRGGDYIGVFTRGGAASATVSVVTADLVWISCTEGPQVKVPRSAVKRKRGEWGVHIIDWVSEDEEGFSIVDEEAA